MEQPFGEDKTLIPNTRVGFLSHFEAALNAVGFVLPAGGGVVRIPFDWKNYDTLNEFSLVTNTFTASQTGFYVFMGSIITHNVNANIYTQIWLRRNGGVRDNQLIQQTFVGWHYHHFHALLYLIAGDIIEVVGRQNDPINNIVLDNLIGSTWFSGHRLS
jgi:hypothetical protein